MPLRLRAIHIKSYKISINATRTYLHLESLELSMQPESNKQSQTSNIWSSTVSIPCYLKDISATDIPYPKANIPLTSEAKVPKWRQRGKTIVFFISAGSKKGKKWKRNPLELRRFDNFFTKAFCLKVCKNLACENKGSFETIVSHGYMCTNALPDMM